MVFDCYYLIEYLSQVMTLEPGDIIATGTGSGVGVKMKPRGYMKPGDEVKIEIEKIGCIEKSNHRRARIIQLYRLDLSAL